MNNATRSTDKTIPLHKRSVVQVIDILFLGSAFKTSLQVIDEQALLLTLLMIGHSLRASSQFSSLDPDVSPIVLWTLYLGIKPLI